MTKISLAAFAVLALTSASQAQLNPLTAVNNATSVQALRTTLEHYAQSTSDEGRQAFLWGSILLEGCRGRKPFPQELVSAGEIAASANTEKVGTKALQVWWLLSVGNVHVVPDLRKGKVFSYGTVIENGKPKRVPIYYSPEEDQQVLRLRTLKAQLLVDEGNDDALLMYRWWDKKGMQLVKDDQIKRIALNNHSGFQEAAIAELALREQIHGRPSEWTRRWEKIRIKSTLSVRCLVSREREELAKK